MKHKIFICSRCGNVAAMLRDKGIPILCCGSEMTQITPEYAEAAGEKHVPTCETAGGTIHVAVGAVKHPMTTEHHIEWICLESANVIQYAHLKPDGKPEAQFALCEGDELQAAYSFCNRHALWKHERRNRQCP